MKFNKMQLIISAVAIAGAIGAVLLFAGIIPGFKSSDSKEVRKVNMWGTIEERSISAILDNLIQAPHNIDVAYQQKNPSTFERDFVDALARGVAPDLVIFPSELILNFRNKLQKIPAETVSERTFRDTFADGTDLLIMPGGEIVGIPFLIDPLILYYNRDLFRNDSVSGAPKSWDDFLSSAEKMTKLSEAGLITQSGAAMGVETNIKHFKEILSTLILQTGATIIEKSTMRVSFIPPGAQQETTQNALRFYTDFANPRKTSYTLAKSLPKAEDAFSRETLAMYLGFGSEFKGIREKNPHLNFDVAGMPQLSGGKISLTFGRIYSLGISGQSKNPAAAMETILFLVSKDELEKVSAVSYLAPSRRDLLGKTQENVALATIFREAIKFRGWLDIDYLRTSSVFGQMIQSVYTGAKRDDIASRDAKLQLEALY